MQCSICDFAVVCYYSFHLISFLPQELNIVDNFLSIFCYNAKLLINVVHSTSALKFIEVFLKTYVL